ncbi:hypothetical protein CF327_g7045 [Tilletia walkeri]|uniref:FHA domain-containing protein n=1 Tax=Tilletia walkeri TaxID=117179 RepID=A0A8X7N4B7_9BASI|nr:hypothetical protein CF327_g7045 [Tilletia walkeri]KAE8264716.1 hypothetical protein A4X09_0g6878 [Tilletia walkeri]
MSSTASPHFFTLIPSDNHRLARSIAFLTSDTFTLSLGGTRIDRDSRASPPPHTATFMFDDCAVPVDQTTISVATGAVFLRQEARDGTTRINGRSLDKLENVLLRDGDYLELGYYENIDGAFYFDLRLHVSTSSPPPMLPIPRLLDSFMPTTSFTPATSSVFQALQQSSESLRHLSAELEMAKQQLQDALAREAGHTCTPAPPPRPYGALLAAIRARPPEGDFTGTETSTVSPRASACLPSTSASTSVLASVPCLEARFVLTTPDGPPSSFTAPSSPPVSSNLSPSLLFTNFPATSDSTSRSLRSSPLLDSESSPTSPARFSAVEASSVVASEPAALLASASTSSGTTSVPTSVPASVSSPLSTLPSASSTPALLHSTHPPTSVLTSVLRSATSSSSPSRPLSTAPSSTTSPHPHSHSSSVRLHGSVTSIHLDAALGRLRAAWITARQRTSSASSAKASRRVDSLELLLSRVREEWIRARSALLDTSGLGLNRQAGSVDAPIQATRKSASIPDPTTNSRACPSMLVSPLATAGDRPSASITTLEAVSSPVPRLHRSADLPGFSSATCLPTPIAVLPPFIRPCAAPARFNDPSTHTGVLAGTICDLFTHHSELFPRHAQPAPCPRFCPPHTFLGSHQPLCVF